MGTVFCNIAMSLDGYVAGPDQGPDEPLGRHGSRLHEWVYELDSWQAAHGRSGGTTTPSSAVIAEAADRPGAVVMGRNMFGGGPGPWGDPRWGDRPWRGWWGDEPPFHAPVFVLTHHEREPLEMDGGTTFTFVTDGIEPALAQARAAAKEKDVSIAGGAQTIRQSLAAGVLDEIEINLVPVLLGAGERLFEDLTGPPAGLTVDRVVAAPGVTHVRYRVS